MVKPFQGTAARVVVDLNKDNPFVFEGYQSVAAPPPGDPTVSVTDPKHKSSCKSGTCDGEEDGGLRCADGTCVDVVKIAEAKIAKRKAEAEAKTGTSQEPETSPEKR